MNTTVLVDISRTVDIATFLFILCAIYHSKIQATFVKPYCSEKVLMINTWQNKLSRSLSGAILMMQERHRPVVANFGS
jgi:hypothetical protein